MVCNIINKLHFIGFNSFVEYNCNIYIAIGDYVRLSIDHSAIIIGKSGNTLTTALN